MQILLSSINFTIPTSVNLKLPRVCMISKVWMKTYFPPCSMTATVPRGLILVLKLLPGFSFFTLRLSSPKPPFGISDSLWFTVYNSSMFGSQRSKANKDLPIPFLKIGFNIWFMRFRLKNIFRILSLNRHYYKIPNVVGWIMPPQRCLHLIDVIPQTCEHVSLHGTREFTDMKS